MKGFLHLGIKEETNKVLETLGIIEPTPIQEQAIPVLRSGENVVAQSQTGTGKTLAFVLPMLEKIDTGASHTQGLILAPTRELALQITKEVSKLTESEPEVKILAVYGGQDIEKQLHKLNKGTHIIIATPGRLLDHLRRGTIRLDKVDMLVLDEADQMLHMGFLNEVEEIIAKTPVTRQMTLFSATMPKEIRDLTKRYMKKSTFIKVAATRITVEEIDQLVVETTDRAKQAALRGLLDEHQPFLAILFCRTKRRASALNEALQERGYNSDELHGDLSQAKREKVMKSFRDMKIQFLVATDVAARGLDVEGVTHVYNYDIPHDVESYVHRIGRTGRAGNDGLAVTLVAPKDRMHLDLIEKGIGFSIRKVQSEATADQNHDSGPSRGGDRSKSRNSWQDRNRKGSKPKQRNGREGRGGRQGSRRGR
ncbi:DEAD/DEAH box helicase [Bacillus sp. H-16]|uniref:DEAD/DEAH box helicase n=1 Tax=Alteribacter salitolerans TaxID=2912333 RepID=UPI0019656F1E|nr:DEAD/DEAH box helicase [Alteribacter salitolerans]MBM7095458.1 DEAD/DEAH box helicase [Alteribacter salitolerans]